MSDALPLPPRPNLEQYKKLARDLQQACKSSDRDAVRLWAQRWVETLARLHGTADSAAPRVSQHIERRWNKLRETTENAAKCTLAGAQFFLAREHGFTSWPKFARHIEELARTNSPVSAFEAAADAIAGGDAQTLRKLLAEQPGLVRERSTREHRSTLLHYVSANGVEDFRQKTPKNIVEITNVLLDAGAEVDAESDAYGGGCTALGLAATGRLDVLRSYFDESGTRQPHADQKRIESAFLYACGYGSPAAASFLLDRGIDPATRNKDGQTGLHWACWGPHIDVIKLLLERGAPVDVKDNRFQATPLDMAVWTWNNSRDQEDRDGCYEAIALLVRAGAKLDREHWRDPQEDDSVMLERVDSDERMLAALRGEP